MVYWVRLEAQQGNYGSYQTPDSALGLINMLYVDNELNLTGILIWSAIQYYQNVDDLDLHYAQRLFEKARVEKGKVFYLNRTFKSYDEWVLYLEKTDPKLVLQNAKLHQIE